MQLIVKYYIQRKVMKTVSVRLEWREEEGKVIVGISFVTKCHTILVVSKIRMIRLTITICGDFVVIKCHTILVLKNIIFNKIVSSTRL